MIKQLKRNLLLPASDQNRPLLYLPASISLSQIDPAFSDHFAGTRLPPSSSISCTVVASNAAAFREAADLWHDTIFPSCLCFTTGSNKE